MAPLGTTKRDSDIRLHRDAFHGTGVGIDPTGDVGSHHDGRGFIHPVHHLGPLSGNRPTQAHPQQGIHHQVGLGQLPANRFPILLGRRFQPPHAFPHLLQDTVMQGAFRRQPVHRSEETNRHVGSLIGQPAGGHKAVAAVVPGATQHRHPPPVRVTGQDFPRQCGPGVFHQNGGRIPSCSIVMRSI